MTTVGGVQIFYNSPDAAGVHALLHSGDGNFYGAMAGSQLSGAFSAEDPSHKGAIFRLTTDGVSTILAWFSGTNGTSANTLIEGKDGNFYGTTSSGGPYKNGSPTLPGAADGDGTVFRLTRSGILSTLASFNTTNGKTPITLIQGKDGNLYGTTSEGGPDQNGTIFRLTMDGTLTTLSTFPPGYGFSGYNHTTLIQGADGNLYGAAVEGGPNGAGAVFRLTTDGVFSTFVAFDGNNGSAPLSLIQGNDGNFYGTAYRGGPEGGGTLFRVTANGVLSILAAWKRDFSGQTGEGPRSLIQGDDGNLYGTFDKMSGGDFNMGAVFTLAPDGRVKTLGEVRFPNLLIQGKDGNLYGTTSWGAVFRVAVVEPPPTWRSAPQIDSGTMSSIDRIWLQVFVSATPFPRLAGSDFELNAAFARTVPMTDPLDTGKFLFSKTDDRATWEQRARDYSWGHLTALTDDRTRQQFFRAHTNYLYTLRAWWLDRDGIPSDSSPVAASFSSDNIYFWIEQNPSGGWTFWRPSQDYTHAEKTSLYDLSRRIEITRSQMIPNSLPIGSESNVRVGMVSMIDRIWVELDISDQTFSRARGGRPEPSAGFGAAIGLVSYAPTAEPARFLFGTGANATTWEQRAREIVTAYLLNFTQTNATFVLGHSNHIFQISIFWLDRDGLLRSTKRSDIGGSISWTSSSFWIERGRDGNSLFWHFRSPWDPSDGQITPADIAREVSTGWPVAVLRAREGAGVTWVRTGGVYLNLPNVEGGMIQATDQRGTACFAGGIVMDLVQQSIMSGYPANGSQKLVRPSERILEVPLDYLKGGCRGYLAAKFLDGTTAFYDLQTGERLPKERAPSLPNPAARLTMLSGPPRAVWIVITGKPFSSFTVEHSTDLRIWTEERPSLTPGLTWGYADGYVVHDDSGLELFSLFPPANSMQRFYRARYK